MSYNDENISDKLKKRAGTDLSDFSDESLQRVYEDSLLGIKYKGDDWDERKKDSYIEEYGTIAYNKMRDEVDYEGMQGQGGDQDNWKKYAEDGTGNWNTVRQAVGIKSLDSKNDIQEMFKKVNDEYMKRMIGAGVDGLAKAEDIAEPATTAAESKPLTSDTLLSARKKTKEYEEEIRPTLGDSMFGDFEPPEMEGGPKDINSKTGRPNDKTYLDEYKMNIADKMTPIKSDGTRSKSKYAKMREDRKRQRQENRRKQTNRQLA